MMGMAIVEITMNRQAKLIKTEKGSEEIRNRKYNVSQSMQNSSSSSDALSHSLQPYLRTSLFQQDRLRHFQF